jgi:hypothetical protein
MEFRQAAAASSDAKQARRLLALAAIRDGLSRQIAARIGAWIGKHCVIGCMPITSTVWKG